MNINDHSVKPVGFVPHSVLGIRFDKLQLPGSSLRSRTPVDHHCEMAGFTKLFSDIVDSSIWEEDPFTCKVWVTLLALADCDGFVRGSPGWLAGKSRVSIEQCNAALEKFKSPDPRSRTPDYDGCRVEQLEDGWLILNYITFRNRLSTDPQAVSSRERMRKHREKHRSVTERNVTQHSVTPLVSASASASVHQEGGTGETDDIPTQEEVTAYGDTKSVPRETCKAFFDYHQGNRLWLNKHQQLIDWRHKLVVWRENDRGKPPNGAGRPSSPAATIFAAKTQIEALKEQVSKHKANPESVFFSKDRTDLEKADLRAKRLKIKQLEELIASQQIA